MSNLVQIKCTLILQCQRHVSSSENDTPNEMVSIDANTFLQHCKITLFEIVLEFEAAQTSF